MFLRPSPLHSLTLPLLHSFTFSPSLSHPTSLTLSLFHPFILFRRRSECIVNRGSEFKHLILTPLFISKIVKKGVLMSKILCVQQLWNTDRRSKGVLYPASYWMFVVKTPWLKGKLRNVSKSRRANTHTNTYTTAFPPCMRQYKKTKKNGCTRNRTGVKK